MLETILIWLAIVFVVVLVVAIAGYFVLRWAFMRTAERFARMIDRRIGGTATKAFTGLTRFANARGISLDDANRIFGKNVDRLARVMDSAITLPIVGRIGLDAVLDLIPGVGNLAGAAVSLTLIARTLQYGPPPSLVSKMLSNVLVDVLVGAIPIVGPLVDIWWKANDKNAALMREFLSKSDFRS